MLAARSYNSTGTVMWSGVNEADNWQAHASTFHQLYVVAATCPSQGITDAVQCSTMNRSSRGWGWCTGSLLYFVLFYSCYYPVTLPYVCLIQHMCRTYNILALCLLHGVHILNIRYVIVLVYSCADIWSTLCFCDPPDNKVMWFHDPQKKKIIKKKKKKN